jgi:geranylgeranylglycerol-phosphate geranylgeranyltransferase
VRPWGKLVRIGNTLVSFFGTIVGGLAAYGSFFAFPVGHWELVLLAAGSTACVTAGGNVLNDILDRESDRTNHPDRPLVTGAISVRGAKGLTVGLFVASVVLVIPVIPVAPLVGVILAVALAALLTYEFRFKSLGLAGNLMVAFLTGAVFLYGGAAVGNVVVVIPFALMAFFATLSREVIKDMEDVAGDVDRRTLPQTHGMGTASVLARASVAVAVALSPIPVLTFLQGSLSVAIIYLGLVLAADALFVVSVLWLPKQLHREQTLSKGAMTVALLAFLATAFR